MYTVHAYKRMPMCPHKHTCIRMHTLTFTYMGPTNIHTYIYIYAYENKHTCIRAHIHIYTRTNTRTNIPTYSLLYILCLFEICVCVIEYTVCIKIYYIVNIYICI